MTDHSVLIDKLLRQRGIAPGEATERFLKPDYARDIHDPMLLKDAPAASARIIKAIESGEKIGIFSDYDCDGIPGAAMFYDLFRRIGYTNFLTYIPHRHNEGFGLNKAAVDSLADKGVKVLITIDCGISNREEVAHANARGMDVIVTDHHEPPAELPPAMAVIDPKQSDCAYPDKNLCGTGVAFKLIQAVLAQNRFGLKEGHEKWLLDLVGIATMSDMVPLVGENRVFAHYGMQVLRKSPRKGLRRLLSMLKINQEHLTEDDLAFMITPRINAASRMGVPMDAFDLLTADTDEDANARAKHLDAINNERKGIVAALVKEVKKTIRERHPEGGASIPSVIVLGNPEWRPSLLGLAANSCAEEFRRPVFLWGKDGVGIFKGSCRSEGTSNVVEIMRAAPAGTFGEFGGHKHSGGFGVIAESIHHLEQRLNDAAAKLAADAAAIAAGNAPRADGDIGEEPEYEDEEIETDEEQEEPTPEEITLDDVDTGLYETVNQLAPFGVGNRKPNFILKSVSPVSVRAFGKTNDHVELVFNRQRGPKLNAIAFFGATEDWAQQVKPGQKIDLIANIEKSMFRNRPEIRLRVVDVVYS
ncbi:MAG TPA: single-stranded-DNA-specific exonuclease RecJ [Candidatus Paceibacterota bacterium]